MKINRFFKIGFGLCSLGLCLALMACAGGGASPQTDTSGSGGADDDSFALETVSAEQERANNRGLSVIGWDVGMPDGEGVSIAMIDTGIDLDHPELQAAISGLSRSVMGGGTNDYLGHGTAMAGVIVAQANNMGLVGIAPDIELVSIKADDGEVYQPDDIAEAVRYARSLDIPIVNMSLSTVGYASVSVEQELNKSIDAGHLIVASAGNTNGSYPNGPANMAKIGKAGALLSVGAVDANKRLASFSNHAGFVKNYHLVAPGVDILTTADDGRLRVVSGSSIATALVSGAAAVVLSRDLHLSGADIANILLETTEDLGEPGVDTVYGRGLLRLDRALQPIGALTIATGDTVDGASIAANDSQGSLSSALNVAGVETALGSVLALDDYKRSYYISPDLSTGGASAATGTAALEAWAQGTASLAPQQSAWQFDAGAAGLSYDLYQSQSAPLGLVTHLPLGDGTQALQLHYGDADQGLGFHQQAEAPLVAARVNPVLGLYDSAASFSVAQDLGTNWQLRSGGGAVVTLGQETALEPASMQFTQTEIGYHSQNTQLGASLGMMHEGSQALGSALTGAFGRYEDTASRYVSMDLRHDVGGLPGQAWSQGWSLAGQFAHSWTDAAEPGGLLVSQSELKASAWSLGLERSYVQGATRHRWGLEVAQPLRVYQGSLLVDSPTARDLEGNIQRQRHMLDLAPDKRQLDIKAQYQLYGLDENQGFEAQAVVSFNPQHENAAPEYGLGARYVYRF